MGRDAHDERLLTEAGRELLPALHALLTWGLRHAFADDDPLRGRRRGNGDWLSADDRS